MSRISSAVLFMILALTARAQEVDKNEEPEVPPRAGFVESVKVEAFYLCDGYDSFGDASFYDCAQRFFREGVKPAGEEYLKGTWRCRSAVNGPTANHEQTIKFGHYRKGKPGTENFVDKLLVQKIFSDNPKAKRMYRDHLNRPSIKGARFNALVGETIRGNRDWVSTNWAYVQIPQTIKLFTGNIPRYFDTRSAFRFYKGRLLIEHVAPNEARDHLWKVVTEDPRSTRVRDRVREQRAKGETVSQSSAARLFDELLIGELYKEGNPYRTAWTKESLQAAKPIARYPASEGDEREWSFPITYSECQRYWDD